MNQQTDTKRSHYQLLLNSAAEGIYEIDTKGECVFCNKAALRMLGYGDQSEVDGKNMHHLIHHSHEDRSAYPMSECKIFRAFTEGIESHVDNEVLWTKQGTSFPAEYWSYPIFKEGNIIGSAVTFLDITERRKTQAALARSERRLKGVIEGTNVGTWEWNVLTGETILNQRWAGIVGYTLEELAPVSIETWNTLAHPDDLIESGRQLKRLFAGEISYYDAECRMKHKNGQWIWVHDRGKVTEWTADGEPLLVTGTHSDITAKKEAEFALRESEAKLHELNATKDKFFSIIAHDLKSPFNTIMGFTEILVDSIRSGNVAATEEYAAIILESSRNTLNLLTNLLEWSRSQANGMTLHPENFEIVTIINEIITIFMETANQKSISLVKIAPPDIVICADKQMVATVVRNLISNAIKYTRPSGTVWIEIKGIPEGVFFEVKDSGIGMSEDQLRRLFRIDQSFSTQGTNNEHGTGLGLLLCKEFVDKHGGEIRVVSRVGQGSTFSCTLPSLKFSPGTRLTA